MTTPAHQRARAIVEKQIHKFCCEPALIADIAAALLESEHALAAKEAQLPEEMKHCTIVFKECAKGHGWLTATNWVQHECFVCALAAKEALVARLNIDLAASVDHCDTLQAEVARCRIAIELRHGIRNPETCPEYVEWQRHVQDGLTQDFDDWYICKYDLSNIQPSRGEQG